MWEVRITAMDPLNRQWVGYDLNQPNHWSYQPIIDHISFDISHLVICQAVVVSLSQPFNARSHEVVPPCGSGGSPLITT